MNKLLRSLSVGASATVVDLALLGLLIGALDLTPRAANVPALLAGAGLQFFGNRHFAFHAGRGRLGRQLLWFSLSEAVTLGLNALLYDLVAARVALLAWQAMALRLAVSAVVFGAWSYPVWRRIFRVTEPTPISLRADLG